MVTIVGGNNPGNRAHVDGKGRLSSTSTTINDQQAAAFEGDAYNLNTGEVTLTTDAETPLFYLKNTGETRTIKISRIFITALASTGGVGAFRTAVYYGASAGTILSAPELPLFNFNATSAKSLAVDARIGATGVTFTPMSTTAPIRSLYPAAGIRSLTAFDHIVLPQGGAVLFAVTPPTGNTSMTVLAGLNAYLSEA